MPALVSRCSMFQKSVTCSSAADNSGCREQSDGSSSFGRQQFTTEESARTADESEVPVAKRYFPSVAAPFATQKLH